MRNRVKKLSCIVRTQPVLVQHLKPLNQTINYACDFPISSFFISYSTFIVKFLLIPKEVA